MLSHVWFCIPMDCRTPGFPLFSHLPEFAQTNVHVSWWCHPMILSSVIPFSCPQSFPASGSFPVSWLFAADGQSIRALASVLPMNIQGWFPLGLTGLIIQGTLKNLLQHHSSKASILWHSAFFMVQLSHPYVTTGNTIVLTIWTFVGGVMSLLFNALSRFVIAFLPRSNCLLISWLQSLSAVILELKKIVCHCFHCSHIYLPWSDGTRCHDLSFLNVEL